MNDANEAKEIEKSALALPTLPKVTLFVQRLLKWVIMILVINVLATSISFLVSSGNTPTRIVGFISNVAGLNTQSLWVSGLIVIIFAWLASFLTSIWPASSLLKDSIRFFHNVQHCDRVAHEINNSAYVDPASVQSRREWAAEMIRVYVGRRVNGKIFLVILVILAVSMLCVPWLLLLSLYEYEDLTYVLAGAPVLLVAYELLSDMRQFVWPKPGSIGLLGGNDWKRA